MPWKPHLYRVGSKFVELDEQPSSTDEHRREIEPWLSAVFQSEHLSLLVGNGLSTAIVAAAGGSPPKMTTVDFPTNLKPQIDAAAQKRASDGGRSNTTIEDQLWAAIQLDGGLQVLGDPRAAECRSAITSVLTSFTKSILAAERAVAIAIKSNNPQGSLASSLLVAFLLSFASRTVSRERLHMFTTNYDRILEFGCDTVGLRPLDRFVGLLEPIFRSSRLDVDIHYNPPGIRGEPRYLEGVIRYTKLHGSLDWTYQQGTLRRAGIPFGAADNHPALPTNPFDSLMIFPNPAKDRDTVAYPYAELFRDFSAALCRPNSTLVTYGYGFGDDHINRIIIDMLSLPSTHLVIISYDDGGGRIDQFLTHIGRNAQTSLLIGNHFGGLDNLVRYYLPKPAIDNITFRRAELLRRRESPGPGLNRKED